MPSEDQSVMPLPAFGETPNAAGQPIRRAVLAALLRSALGSQFDLCGVPRLFWLTARPLLGGSPALFELEDGIIIRLDPGDYFQVMMFYGRYSKNVFSLMRQYVNDGDTVIDLGAQLGFITTKLAKWVGKSGRVYSFEPDPNATKRSLRPCKAMACDRSLSFLAAHLLRMGIPSFLSRLNSGGRHLRRVSI